MAELPVSPAAMDALKRGDMTGAIKAIREASGGDLKGALEIAQRAMAEMQRQQPGKAPGSHSGPHRVPEPRAIAENRERTAALARGERTPTVMPGDSGGRGAILLLIVAAAAAAVWLLWR